MEKISVSILKRTGRDVFYLQYRDPLTGRKVTKSAKTTSRSQAERAAAKWEKEIEAGADKRHGRMAWSEFRDRYEDEVVTGLAPRTATKIDGVFNSFEAHVCPQHLRDANPDRLTTYVKKMREDGRAESTIKGNLAHLRAALAWAADLGLIAAVPKMPKVQRAKSTKIMKGRPITGEEFERMLAKVADGLCLVNQAANKPRKAVSKEARDRYRMRQQVAVAGVVDSWKFYLRGLWTSGLRLSESLDLHWTDCERLRIDMSCRHPMLRIPAEREKGHKDRLLPIAPEFAQLLMSVPADRRKGFVFNPLPVKISSDRLGEQHVGRAISCIGKAANVKVNEKVNGAVKYASAHDLRRSFGDRWALRVMPQILMELMRHESIETTLRYYVGRNAQTTAGILWEAAEKAGSVAGDTLGDTTHAATR